MIHLVMLLKSLLAEERITIQDEEPGTPTTVAPLFPFLVLLVVILFPFLLQLSHFHLSVCIFFFYETRSVIPDILLTGVLEMIYLKNKNTKYST